MATPVALILGVGSNIGRETALAFKSKGYHVALVSRTIKEEESTSNQLHLRADFTKPNGIESVFEKVKAKLGLPHVVVYNAGAVAPQDSKDPLNSALTLTKFTENLNVNVTSAFVAAQQAVSAFDQLPSTAARTFIYTGNICNVSPIVGLIDLGIGKSASAHLIQCAAQGCPKGYKFYYADERRENGEPMYNAISGAAHGKIMLSSPKAKSRVLGTIPLSTVLDTKSSRNSRT